MTDWLTWFILHPGCTGPHVDATSVCLELMLQLPPRWVSFFEGPSLLHLPSLSLACQVFSGILQLPTVVLASGCVLHLFLWHDWAIAFVFLRSPSRSVFFLFCSVLLHSWLYLSRWCQECFLATCGGLLPIFCSVWQKEAIIPRRRGESTILVHRTVSGLSPDSYAYSSRLSV